MATLAAAVRGGAAAAVLSSASLVGQDVEDLSALISSSPATIFAGLAAPAWPPDGSPTLLTVLAATVEVGRAGELAFPRPERDTHWALLARSIAAARLTDPVQRACVAAVLGEIWGRFRTVGGGHTETAVHGLFAAAFDPEVDTVADVASRLGVEAAVLAGWFVRRRLPGADRYVAAARLVRAAWTGERPSSDAVAAASWQPHPEAPARIHRVARRLRRLATLQQGATPGQDAGMVALSTYRAALLGPFRDAFRGFDPAREAAFRPVLISVSPEC